MQVLTVPLRALVCYFNFFPGKWARVNLPRHLMRKLNLVFVFCIPLFWPTYSFSLNWGVNANGVDCNNVLSYFPVRRATKEEAADEYCNLVGVLACGNTSIREYGESAPHIPAGGSGCSSDQAYCFTCTNLVQTNVTVYAVVLNPPPTTVDILKNNGQSSCDVLVGNPINSGTGNKFLLQEDFNGSTSQGLTFIRYYNSLYESKNNIGFDWSHTYSRKITLTYLDTNVAAIRPDGQAIPFQLAGSVWKSDADITAKLEQFKDTAGVTSGWRYTTSEDEVELYDAAGMLLSITSRNGLTRTVSYSDGTPGLTGGYVLDALGNPTTTPLPPGLMIRLSDASGRALNFGYDKTSRIVLMRDPANQVYHYEYDANNNLSKVTYPDGKAKQYLYAETAYTGGASPSPAHALTGIIDENSMRYATYAYDFTGRAISTEHAGSAGHVGLIYSDPYSSTVGGVPGATVTDPLGTPRTYKFTTILGVVKSAGTNQPGGSGCGAAASSVTYDANGNIASRTDFNGNKTTYIYDLTRNLETSRTEAAGTSVARTITTTWHPTFRLPTQITEPGRVTNPAYDATTGNLLTKSITDTVSNTTRTWTDAYTTAADGTLDGLLKTVDGPRTDVSDITSYTYYPNGDLKTVTNALGHVTQITSYDPNGHPLTVVDPNGLTTTLSYTPRGWLASRTIGPETTRYTYDGVGQLTQVLLPDSSNINYTYDAAHRLTDITDTLGNRIHYTLDNIGNRTQENVYDNLNTLVQTKSRAFDALNRLWKEISALNQTTLYTYDPDGNLTSITDPLTHTTVNAYDALNRLTQVTDAASGVTRYGYDPLDQLKSVTDPRNLVTSYNVNALGDQTQLTSPDTGVTNKTYDSAGNLKTSTDARGQVSTYSYDALNRVSGISYTSGTAISFTYDSGPNALGRLTQMSDEAGTTTWTYNSQGRIASRTQTEGTLSQSLTYAYDGSGRLSQVTYPSGRIISYGYDAQGRINTLKLNGLPLLSNVQYQAFGPAKSWTWGNNTNYNRSFDNDGRMASYPLGTTNLRSLSFDAASRIYGITDTSPAANQVMGYDTLDRLTSWVAPNVNQSYSFDANGNRTSLTLGSTLYSYLYPAASNRLASVAGPTPKTESYDLAGNLIGDGTNSFVYNSRGRLSQVTAGGSTVSYLINGLGQRIVKNGASPTYFLFDQGGHLTGEYDASNTPIEETVYLGEIPVAVLK
jgi:YD repeat-containing protein